LILIYGKGKTGKGVERLLKKKSIPYKITDDTDFNTDLLENTDLIVVSPGIPFFHRIYKEARIRKIPVVGEIEFSYRFFDGSVIAVTGTDGKSTTSKLIHHIIGEEKADIGGNYGTPFSDIVSEGKDTVVLELSSFQIYSTEMFRPDIAVFLNFYPDHLDWHKKLLHYRLSKYRLFRNMKEEDPAVLNFDDQVVRNTPKKGKRYYFSLSPLPDNLEGAYYDGSEIVLKINGFKFKFGLSDIHLKGIHNIQNIMASVVTAYIYGIDPETIEERLKSFKPLPHRMEYVGSINGVDFYNDSKATTVQAVKKAVQSFDGKRVILITGGINKGGDFSDLRDELLNSVKEVFIIGRDRKSIYSMIKDYVKAEIKESLEDAVNTAFKKAEKGDVILLSPGCASFDMFKNYQERGEIFKSIVRKLKDG